MFSKNNDVRDYNIKYKGNCNSNFPILFTSIYMFICPHTHIYMPMYECVCVCTGLCVCDKNDTKAMEPN